MIQLQQLLQREKSYKEVVALLHQHLDIRPVSPSFPGPVAQGLMMLEVVVTGVFMYAEFLVYGDLFDPRHPLLGGLAPSPHVLVISSGILLILAIAALVLHLFLPVGHPIFNYLGPLGILSRVGSFLGCFGLASIFLPPSPTHTAVGTAFGVGIGAGMVVAMLSLLLTGRKDTRLLIARVKADLMKTHLQLEQIELTRKHVLKRLKKEKDQTALEKATQADIPRFYLARHPDGTFTVAFKADLPIPIMQRLAEMQPKTAFTNHEAVQRILEEDTPCEDIWIGKIYTFPEASASPDYPGVTPKIIPWDYDWEAEEQDDKEEEADEENEDEEEETPEQPDVGEAKALLLASIVNERIVVACRAQKINEVAAEAWVQPEPSDRNEARQVTLAWAYEMQRNGKIPFFSHHNDDEGAADLARGLGLSLVVEEVDYY